MNGAGVFVHMERPCRRLLCVLAGVCAVLAAWASSAAAAQIESEQGIGFTKSATLEAQINPQGEDTTCQAQYATQQAFETEGGWAAATTIPCSPEDLGSGAAAVTAVAKPSGLSLQTVYHFRFLAKGGGTTVEGPDETFATFGFESFSFGVLDAQGNPFVQAGGHPYEFKTAISIAASYNVAERAVIGARLKDLSVSLPPGLIGNPAATPRCPEPLEARGKCPGNTQIGTFEYELRGDAKKGVTTEKGRWPLFNVVPPQGTAARFGASLNGGISVYLDSGIRSGSDYGVYTGSFDSSSFATLKRMTIRLWGVPGDASHDAERACPNAYGSYEKGCAFEGAVRPFLRNPTSCTGPSWVGAWLDSYQEPGEGILSGNGLPADTGCENVQFHPSVAVRSTTGAADATAGLNVDLHFPQNENPEGVSNSDLKDVVLSMPRGLTVNPSSADGLEGCSEAQVGFTGFTELNKTAEPGVRTAQFTPGPAQCPDGSKLGSVQIDTPLLEHPVPGGLYLASPHANPFGSLLAVYVAAYDPVSGVVIKLPGLVQADPQTGQLTETFLQNPQQPFEDLKVSLFEGSRASFTTPMACGSYAAGSVLTPWDGNGPVSVSSPPFAVSEAPGGGACVSSEGAAPDARWFSAGTVSPIAGSYAPFVVKVSREDGSQHLKGLDVTLPPGLIGKIAGVGQCPQADIEQALRRSHEGEGALEAHDPSCPDASEVGVVHVGTGSGAPFYVSGRAYFAGPYEGAPFSLVFVTPAIAGPFDLGTVVVRAGLRIDPRTAQVSVVSDPFPAMLDGIPLDIRSVSVDVNRSGFMLNPTSCAPMAVTGSALSTTGQSAALSDRFQVGGCDGMPFGPVLTASTSGKTSRKDGASLTLSIVASGGQANIGRVKIQLPKQLPSRQSTLELACPEAQFAANPAGCPSGSVVGSAKVITPLLSVPLAGPAYFVSHGNVKFPELVMVLQGQGITIDLSSQTNIDEKTGVITSTAESVPDAPFTSFQLNLPEGSNSVLAAPAGVCSGPLVMPTVLTGQNGVVVHRQITISATGCSKQKTTRLTRAQKLKRALKACRTKDKGSKRHARRKACERRARRKYGPVGKKHKHPGHSKRTAGKGKGKK